MRWFHLLASLPLVLGIAGCSKDSTPGANPKDGAPSQTPPANQSHSGDVIELGTTSIGRFSAHATRDRGDIVPGKDAPIDVTVTSTDGSAKVSAVRFWIGLEDAKVSVKAKAAIENPAQPDRWHTHAEIPSPLPDGSALWVEIEAADGATSLGKFDLKR